MLTGTSGTVRIARRLRKAMTLPEVVLWTELRKRPGGLKFRRQHAAGPYILDFFCAAAGMAVEVDGEGHGRGIQPDIDHRRGAWLAARNVQVLRLPATLVLQDMEAAIAYIVARVSPGHPLHQPMAGPPPRSGEEQETS